MGGKILVQVAAQVFDGKKTIRLFLKKKKQKDYFATWVTGYRSAIG